MITTTAYQTPDGSWTSEFQAGSMRSTEPGFKTKALALADAKRRAKSFSSQPAAPTPQPEPTAQPTGEQQTTTQRSHPTPVDFEKRKANRELPTERVLELLQRWLPRAYELAEVVGKWVWVSFPEQQPPQITSELSQLGFHWNSKRKVWQHPCGVFKGEPVDPRTRYQSFHPADQVAA